MSTIAGSRAPRRGRQEQEGRHRRPSRTPLTDAGRMPLSDLSRTRRFLPGMALFFAVTVAALATPRANAAPAYDGFAATQVRPAAAAASYSPVLPTVRSVSASQAHSLLPSSALRR